MNSTKLNQTILTEYQLIIGEVKSDKSSLEQSTRQMEKYAKVELADKIYSIIPNCLTMVLTFWGNCIFEKHKLFIRNSNKSLSVNPSIQKLDCEWINTNIKLNLLGNVPFSKLTEQLETKYSQSRRKKLDHFI